MLKTSKMPFIKWSGSKRKQAPYIVSQFPKQIETYYECFIGGASVLHELLNKIAIGEISCKNIVCSDINKDLINTWNMFKNPETRQKLYDGYCKLHWALKERGEYIEGTEPNRTHITKCQTFYYEMRQKYNDYIDRNEYCDDRTIIFYWITRTCFNGLIRYNPKNNHFNASFHVGGRFGIMPDELKQVFDSWGSVIDSFVENGGTIDFICASYNDVICKATIGDLVYMDPPYENTTGMYFCNGFDTDLFWNVLMTMNMREVKWLLSYDGISGDSDLTADVPHLYKRHEYVNAGHSSFKKLKSKTTKEKKNKDVVKDSLYINY